MRRRWNGFTILELLVVVGIILVLASILIPVFQSAMEKGREVKCAANLRELQVATMNQASYSGRLPFSASFEYEMNYAGNWLWQPAWVNWLMTNYSHTASTADKTTYWRGSNAVACITNGTLWRYINDLRAYLCPTFARPGVCKVNDAKRNYVMNAGLSYANLYALTTSSRVLLFADGGLYVGVPKGAAQYSDQAFLDNLDNPMPGVDFTNSWFYGVINYYFQNATDGMLQGYTNAATSRIIEHIGEYHRNNQGNVVFVDGHVEKVGHRDTGALCAGIQ
jgi:prepilin-type processing-associated H-X9-DG protein/prepilin-type N-terminal cleavage/methylation domain-containing protein